MAKAIEAGIPKLRIEAAAARTQARIDSGQQCGDRGQQVQARCRTADRRAEGRQCERARAAGCAGWRACAPSATRRRRRAALRALTEGARGDANLLALAIEAARARATVGEMSLAMENAFGRHVAEIRSAPGVYRREAGPGIDAIDRVIGMTEDFLHNEGRRPRILVAKIGQDGHDRGQKIIASAFADLGFDVDIGPLFATPDEVARQAVDNDVHIVGVSSLAAGHLILVPALKNALRAAGRPDVMIAVGGVIPAQDFEALREAGADAIFPPGTVIAEAAASLLEQLNRQLGYAQKSVA